VKVERIEEDHAGHNSGGAGKAIAIATSLDDESSHSCNSNSKKLG
jgi:hypothetical protein